MQMQDIFDRIANSKASNGGMPGFTDGRYRLRVARVFFHQAQEGQLFIAEHRVEKAEPVFSDIEPSREGSFAAYRVPMYGNAAKAAPGNIKAYILAVLGVKEADLSPQQLAVHLQKIVSDANPARGQLLEMETSRRIVKSDPPEKRLDAKGRPRFMATSWTHVATPDLAAGRASLDSSR